MRHIDWSARGRARVYAFTALGTVVCILATFALDTFSFSSWEWRWTSEPLNDFIIPLLIAPPFFYYLLSRVRLLAIAHHELAELAATDSLTSMLNRRAFTEIVEGYIRRMESRTDRPANALLVIDVDNFKSVNDQYGHDAGDEALVLIARAITASLQENDLAGRMGGEEFGIFLPGKPPEVVGQIAELLRTSVKDIRFEPEGHRHRLTISVGGTVFTDTPTFKELYKRADQQLYFAKRNGRDRVELNVLVDRVPSQDGYDALKTTA